MQCQIQGHLKPTNTRCDLLHIFTPSDWYFNHSNLSANSSLASMQLQLIDIAPKIVPEVVDLNPTGVRDFFLSPLCAYFLSRAIAQKVLLGISIQHFIIPHLNHCICTIVPSGQTLPIRQKKSLFRTGLWHCKCRGLTFRWSSKCPLFWILKPKQTWNVTEESLGRQQNRSMTLVHIPE